uniref:RNA-directed DNA polymerase from mobile element jockey n=1 Tax=Parasteatoda tepidariorum TaxID=114398 RepID=A0A2L2YZE0_PARTP
MQQTTKNNILICHWNAGGLRPKINDLKIFCQQYNPDIILLQETKLKPNEPIKICNYAFFHTPRSNCTRGQYGGT